MVLRPQLNGRSHGMHRRFTRRWIRRSEPTFAPKYAENGIANQEPFCRLERGLGGWSAGDQAAGARGPGGWSVQAWRLGRAPGRGRDVLLAECNSASLMVASPDARETTMSGRGGG